MTFRAEKLEWLGYPTVKKLQIYLFISTECTNVTERQTDRQTPHDDIGRAYPSHRATINDSTAAHEPFAT